MASRVKILSLGSVATTQILVDGIPMEGVTKIVIHPIEAGGGAVTATITVRGVDLVLNAETSLEEVTS